MKKNVARKLKKNGMFDNMLIKISVLSTIVFCAVMLVAIQTDCAEKETDLAKINEKIIALEAENDDLSGSLNETDISSYMEQVALEEQGYAYPDERRFYDTSRD